MMKLIYNSYLFYKCSSIEVVKMKIDNILILANNNFANIEEKLIKNAKIIIKD